MLEKQRVVGLPSQRSEPVIARAHKCPRLLRVVVVACRSKLKEMFEEEGIHVHYMFIHGVTKSGCLPSTVFEDRQAEGILA